MYEYSKDRIKAMAIPVIGVLLLSCIGWYLLRDVSGDGGAINVVRNELVHARDEQRTIETRADRITNGLVESERRAEELREAHQRITIRVADLEGRNRRSEELIKENARLISESRSVLAAIRKKGETIQTTK